MIKFLIDEEAYLYLNEWAESRKISVKYSPYYFKKVQVLLKGYEKSYKYYVEATRYGYKFNLLDLNGVIIKGRITHKQDSESDFDIEFEFAGQYDERQVHIMQVYCTAFLTANCFMWNGNIIDDKVYSVSGKTSGNDKIFTFRKFKDSVYAVSVGHHRSPDGVFEVRGHFRCYKTGKVVWIDPYLKGLE